MIDTKKQEGSVSLIFTIVFGLLFVLSSVFAVITFVGKSDLDANFDKKVAADVAVAVEEAKAEQELEFVEREKQPNRKYTGSGTFGSLTFDYPKTWSVYAKENTSGTVLDMYASPLIVPAENSDRLYALRVEIVSKAYDKELQSYENDIERGRVSVAAFRPEMVPEVLGVTLTGEIERNIQGKMILLPLRDRTIKIFTESQEFFPDFDTIVTPSINFVP